MYHLNRRVLLTMAVTGLVGTAISADAATRSFIVTDFDKIRLEAPIAVAVETRRGIAARGEGDAALLERVELRVIGTTLVVRLRPSLFGGRPEASGQVRLFLTAPSLKSAELAGSGVLAIDGMKGPEAEVVATGSGILSVVNLDADKLSIAQTGSSSLRLSGKAKNVALRASGSGAVDAAQLEAADLDLTAEGAGSVDALATRTAKVLAVGPAAVTVSGSPACTVRHVGSGAVSCGGADF